MGADELHDPLVRRDRALLRRLVDGLRQELVQGPGADGHRRGARAARGGAARAVRAADRVAGLSAARRVGIRGAPAGAPLSFVAERLAGTPARRPCAPAARSARPRSRRKSKSSCEIAAWRTPHIASRKSDMKRISSSVAAASSGTSCRSRPRAGPLRASASSSWLTRSWRGRRTGRPFPRTPSRRSAGRAPSSMKFASSGGRCGTGTASTRPRPRSIRAAVSHAHSTPSGASPPRLGRGGAVRLDDAEGVERRRHRRAGVDDPERPADRGEAAPARAAAPPAGPTPSMNRVTSQPSGSRKATTSGPTPTAAAARVASCSARRSIPSSSVSRPATRSTYGVAVVERRPDVVVRDPAAEHLEPRVPARPEPLDRRLDALWHAHARIRSPATGRRAGSAATRPSTHSPKISTATSVPTSCSAGQVGVRDRARRPCSRSRRS